MRHSHRLAVSGWLACFMQDFWVSPEDQLDVFSKFYGLPSLSWRDAVHDLISTNATGFTVADLYFDKGHPNGYNGHRYRPCAGAPITCIGLFLMYLNL